jgi:hypothetical protein
MYGFLKYHVFYLFICAVCCVHVCVSSINSSIHVYVYGLMILNYYETILNLSLEFPKNRNKMFVTIHSSSFAD